MSAGPIDGDATPQTRIEREDSANPFNPPKSTSAQQANNQNSLFHQDDPNRDPNRIRPLNYFPSGIQPTRPGGNAGLAPAFEYAARAAPATDDATRAAPATNEATRAADDATPPVMSDHLTIGLTNGDSEMTFKVRKTIRMKRIMDQYAERSGRSRPALRFLIDGVRVNDEDTPDSLEMEDGDVVEVHQEQIGGYGRMMGEVVVQDDAATALPVPHLTINLKEGRDVMRFKVNSTTKLKRVMDIVAARTGRSRPALRFWIDGAEIDDNDTPKSLEMVDEDIVEVHSEQPSRYKLSISFKDGDDELFFRVPRDLEMKQVLDKYAEHSGKSRAGLRFAIEEAWIQTIQDTDTPETLEMVDGDVVNVHHEQIRGLSSMLSSLAME